MADKVQLTLETLVPEMDVLIQKGYFTKKDVKKIMKKRRFHEYQFEKTDVMPLDFFKAIKYEKILNKRMKKQKKNLNIKKNDYYDFHFIRRIIVLYKKCLIKFNKEDENIWMEYFNFLLVNKCNDILNKEIGRCLTLHPTNITFWKIAAYHEYEDNLNFQNARSLLQKCVKFNPINYEAYLEYFTFEIIFAKNYIERKDILSGKMKKENKAEKKKINIINDINEEKLKMDIDEENEKDKTENDVKQKEEGNNNQIKDLIIPKLIYEDTIDKLINRENKNIDETLEIHFGFLERLEKYGNSSQLNYQKLEANIINNIKEIIKKNKQTELFYIDNEIKIIKIKSLKNSKEEIYNKIKFIFKEFEDNLFIDKYINYYNYISYHFLKFFIIDEGKEENNEAYIDKLIELINPKINIEKIKNEILSFNNLKLLVIISSKEYLINSLLKDKNYDIYTNIFDILAIIFKKNDLSALKDAFSIINNIKNVINNLIEQITSLDIIYEENEKCSNFLEYYIEKFNEIINDEVTYYINPGIMKNYYKLINEQFLKGKVNYVIIKKLYYKMIELIIDKSIQANENDSNVDGKKYYEEAYIYIKDNMKKLLIDRKNIIEEIIKKKKKDDSKNNLLFLNWID